MSGAGRPCLDLHIPVAMWLIVELMRDTHDNRRLSVRRGAQRLEKELQMTFTGDGARVLPWETIRRYHKIYARAMAKDDELKAAAIRLLEIHRQRRAQLGWDDVRAWQWVLLPEAFQLLGGVISYASARDNPQPAN